MKNIGVKMIDYELRLFNPKTATKDDYKARCDFLNLVRKEAHPDDPAVSLESSIKKVESWQVYEDVSVTVWNIWIDNKIVAELGAVVAYREDNKHLIDLSINVLSDYRRRGFGSLLLKKAITIAKENKRTLLMFRTTAKIPAGAEFAKKYKAEVGIDTHVNRLTLDKLDRNLMKSWIMEARAKAKDFELGLWDGDYPENEIKEIVTLIEVMNTAPIDDLDIEDFKLTPEQLRQGEASLRVTATERWTYFVRHKESGELAGYTETYWNLDNPKTVYQGDTGVLPKYRGHALGRWLKAAMVEKVLRDRPDVEYINTGNADSNKHMLAINKAMGFEPYIAEQDWQLRLEQVEEYFSKH